MTRSEAAALSWDELEAAGYCECGRRLRGHPPLAAPAPLTARESVPWQVNRPPDTKRRMQLREAQRRHRARPR